jgi:hypothetical protein
VTALWPCGVRSSKLRVMVQVQDATDMGKGKAANAIEIMSDDPVNRIIQHAQVQERVGTRKTASEGARDKKSTVSPLWHSGVG